MVLRKGTVFKSTAFSLVLSMLLVGAMPTRSLAYVVTNEAYAASGGSVAVPGGEFDRAANMAAVQRLLESKVIGDRLRSMGYLPGEVEDRLAALSDDELHQFASNVDTLYPGGSALGVLVVVLIIAMIVLMVLKITDRKIIIQ